LSSNQVKMFFFREILFELWTGIRGDYNSIVVACVVKLVSGREISKIPTKS